MPKMRGIRENLPRNLLIYCAIFFIVTFRCILPTSQQTRPLHHV